MRNLDKSDEDQTNSDRQDDSSTDDETQSLIMRRKRMDFLELSDDEKNIVISLNRNKSKKLKTKN